MTAVSKPSFMSMPFEKARKIKGEIGAREHRGGLPEFVGDPSVELYDEALDSANYVEEIERRRQRPAPPEVWRAIKQLAEYALLDRVEVKRA